MQIIKGIQTKPYKILIYGSPGTRKSSFASKAEKPVFIDIENGLSRIDCDKTPTIKNWNEFKQAIEWAKSQQEYKTIVFDTIDILEQMLHQHICARENKPSIEKIAYGGGYRIATTYWNWLLDKIDEMTEQGKNTILIAHDDIKIFENPTTDNYNRYTIKINKNSVNLITGRVDGVFFVQQDIVSKTEEKKARTTGEYFLICNESPAIIAKNRFNLPNKVPMKPDFFNYLANFGKEAK